MKVFSAGPASEADTFSPMPAGLAQFEGAMGCRDPMPDPPGMVAVPLVVFGEQAQARGWEFANGLCAHAARQWRPRGFSLNRPSRHRYHPPTRGDGTARPDTAGQ